jgi:cell wall-associated NlpC family hydrolase
MEVRLAQLAAVADEAAVAVQRAGEAYTQALADADEARAAAAAAATRSQGADTDAETARQELMAFARQMARTGGSTELLEVMLSADGFADVANRTTTLSRLTGKADEAVQSYRAAQLVADTLRKRADAAAEAATAAQAAAQAALGEAERIEADAAQQVAAAAAERETLIVRLAEARATSAAVEQARQAELDRQRRERAEAAARAARLAEEQKNATNPSGGGSSGESQTPGYNGGASDGVVQTPASQYPVGSGTSRGSAELGLAAIEWAKTQLGKPYGWGATGPSSYDCSGLTMRAWEAVGIGITRTSRDQYKRVLKIPYSELRPGDLVFWTDDPADVDEIYHVAMWLGDGKIVEAPSVGNPVRITNMRWDRTMPYAGRP